MTNDVTNTNAAYAEDLEGLLVSDETADVGLAEHLDETDERIVSDEAADVGLAEYLGETDERLVSDEAIDLGLTESEPGPDYSSVIPEGRLVVFADPRAAELLLAETIVAAVEDLGVDHVLVDITTKPGLAVAEAVAKTGRTYEALDFGQPKQENIETRFNDALAGAEGVIVTRLEDLADQEGLITLIPAVNGDDSKVLALQKNILTGHVLNLAEAARQKVLIIDAPERGVRLTKHGYLRSVVLSDAHLGDAEEQAAHAATDGAAGMWAKAAAGAWPEAGAGAAEGSQ